MTRDRSRLDDDWQFFGQLARGRMLEVMEVKVQLASRCTGGFPAISRPLPDALRIILSRTSLNASKKTSDGCS
jgi:hypothetical protein